ncbi:MAG: hypothetical protein EOP48_25845 [Sphingobacteriales bacterium]|nr:MAG: hypothetical protein EOP48_25845 [Sphingobacteriales bacterium]
MFRSFSFLISSLFVFILFSCSQKENYKKAYANEFKGKTFIKINGKRQLAAHDPGSVISNKKYEDFLLLNVPSLDNGTVEGNDIPVPPGYYKFLGNVTIKDGKVQVNLSYDNIDDKKIEPLSWNGEYILVRN